jgi:ABC-type Fe3+ transport system substrate-binding protein
MDRIRELRPQKTVSLSAEMKVFDVVDTWPHTLETFVKMGFTPLRNPVLRNTIARRVSLRQAAALRNVDLNILMLNLQTAIANPDSRGQSFVDPQRLRYDENTVPELEGDVRLVGLVPCPVRTLVVEQFDQYAAMEFAAREIRLAWWLAAEGTGAADVKVFLKSIARSRQHRRFPDVFMAGGTELFLFEEFGRALYDSELFAESAPAAHARPEFAALEDPRGKLRLQFAVLFSFACRPDCLGGAPVPRSWFDLTEPRYRGRIVLPALDLPVMPDFLAALHAHLGDTLFVKFSQNVALTAHPARAAARANTSDTHAIFVAPLHFARILKADGDVHVVPDDGFVAVPGYLVQTAAAHPEAARLTQHLLSDTYLETYWRHGGFVPNHRGIAVDVPLERIITRPWRTVHGMSPDTHHRRLLRNLRQMEPA